MIFDLTTVHILNNGRAVLHCSDNAWEYVVTLGDAGIVPRGDPLYDQTITQYEIEKGYIFPDSRSTSAQTGQCS